MRRSSFTASRDMPLLTTVVGSYPKPGYLPLPDWFRTKQDVNFVQQYSETIKTTDTSTLRDAVRKAIQETLNIQDDLGIEIPTDGEIQRESYIHYFCRHLKGIDFDNLTVKSSRNGAWVASLPTIVNNVEQLHTKPWVNNEWKESQEMTKRPVKITLPGPMTIINSVVDSFYNNDYELSRVLVNILNREIQALAESGCQYIQVIFNSLYKFL